MKIQIIEKECTIARVGLSVEFSNSECATIEKTATKLGEKISDIVDQWTEKQKNASSNKQTLKPQDIQVHIDLEHAMRIHWLLTQLTRDNESGLFNTADNECLSVMANINGENNELTNKSAIQ